MPRARCTTTAMPTYQELAAIVAEVAVDYVCNIDSPSPGGRFNANMSITPALQRAVDAREALIEHGVVERRGPASRSRGHPNVHRR